MLDAVARSMGGWGKIAVLTTMGRRTGLPRRVAVGFLEEPDGAILVAADDGAEWARNLEADPAVVVEIADRRYDGTAEPLEPREHATAITGLILKYGTPAERMGRGPSFRIRSRSADVRARHA